LLKKGLERPHVENRLVGIEVPDNLANGSNGGSGFADGLNQEQHLPAGILGERQIKELGRRLADEKVFVGLGDANNLNPPAFGVGEAEALAERVLVRPIVFDELFIDDSDQRRAVFVEVRM
jgi:broad specificity phosphatase PhoE